MSSNSTVNVSEQMKVRMPLLVLLSIIGATAAATVAWSAIKTDLAEAARSSSDHETRIKELERAQADIAVIKNDVRWLRLRAEGRSP